MTPHELFDRALQGAFEYHLGTKNEAIHFRHQCYKWRKRQPSNQWADVIISKTDNVLTFRVLQGKGQLKELEPPQPPQPVQEQPEEEPISEDDLATTLGLDTSKTV